MPAMVDARPAGSAPAKARPVVRLRSDDEDDGPPLGAIAAA